MIRSQAIVFEKPGKVGLTTVEWPAPAHDEIVVRVKACGICMFDVNTYTGKLPLSFPRLGGHEGVGVVEWVGSGVTALRAGDKVTFLGGPALGEYCLTKAASAVLIPPETEDYVAWVAEPAACVVNGLRSARVEPGDTVVLIGAGYMGLLLAQGLGRALTRTFIVVDVDETRLALARSYGARITLNPAQVDAVAEVRRLTASGPVAVRPDERPVVVRLLGTPEQEVAELDADGVARLRAALGADEGRHHPTLTPYEILLAERVAGRLSSGADVVIEAAGARGTLDMASQMVRAGGRLSIFAFHTLREEVDTPTWHMRGYEVQNPAPNFSRNFGRDFRDAVALLGSGVLRQDELITHRFPYTRMAEALETAAARPQGFIKAAITFP